VRAVELGALVLGAGAVLSVVLAVSPTELQLYFAWGLLCVLLVLLLTLRRVKNELLKLVFVGGAALLMLRYLWWRTTSTLNLDELPDAVFSLALYGAELYSIGIALLGMFFSLKPLSRKPVKVKEEELPTVDVFIPTYDEPPEIPEATLLGALNLDYPPEKLRVYLLDDGGTEEKLNHPDPEKRAFFRARAERLKNFVKRLNELGYENAFYLTRKDNRNAKAGNINEALKKTNGELILILDADHVPARDFLLNTVGFMVKNPRAFLVQTPHAFYNPDPVKKNLGLFWKAPAENEMFYFLIQKGFDLWNAAFFCGSAALLRREHLLSAGGIQTQTVTEDAETSLELHARGFESIYYDRPMIWGLNPETLSALISQRVRWAQGMLQILVLKNPLLKRGLSWYQRLAYFNASFFWLFGVARTVFLVAPLAYLLFGLHVYDASIREVLAYPLPHFLASFLSAYYLFSKVRWPFFSEIYESIQGVFLFVPTIKTLLNPRAPVFKVTPKGETLERDFVSPFYGPFFVLYHLILLGFAFAVYRWFAYPDERGTVLVTAAWNAFNLFITTVALFVAYERRQRRRFHRIPARDEVTLFRKSETLAGVIKDLSLGGMAVELKTKPLTGFVRDEEVKALVKDEEGELFFVKAYAVAYDGKLLRLRFAWRPEELESFGKVVELVFSPSSRWQIILELERSLSPWEGFIFLSKSILKDFGRVYRALWERFREDALSVLTKGLRRWAW